MKVNDGATSPLDSGKFHDFAAPVLDIIDPFPWSNLPAHSGSGPPWCYLLYQSAAFPPFPNSAGDISSVFD
jgi:hypothetical protein